MLTIGWLCLDYWEYVLTSFSLLAGYFWILGVFGWLVFDYWLTIFCILGVLADIRFKDAWRFLHIGSIGWRCFNYWLVCWLLADCFCTWGALADYFWILADYFGRLWLLADFFVFWLIMFRQLADGFCILGVLADCLWQLADFKTIGSVGVFLNIAWRVSYWQTVLLEEYWRTITLAGYVLTIGRVGRLFWNIGDLCFDYWLTVSLLWGLVDYLLTIARLFLTIGSIGR